MVFIVVWLIIVGPSALIGFCRISAVYAVEELLVLTKGLKLACLPGHVKKRTQCSLPFEVRTSVGRYGILRGRVGGWNSEIHAHKVYAFTALLLTWDAFGPSFKN